MSTEDFALIQYIDPDQLKKDIAFALTDLDNAMTQHSALYVHYGTLAVRARAQADRWKSTFEILESRLDSQYRTTLKEENPKTTEPQIRAAVVADPKWRAAASRVAEAEAQFRLAQHAERAFEHRKDMLLQISRGQLKEREGQLRMVHNQEGASARERFLKAAGTGPAA